MTACLASIFECTYEDAPRLCDPDTGKEIDQWLRAMTIWANERGYGMWHVGLWGAEHPYLRFGSQEIRYHFAPPGFWIGGVKSPRNYVLDKPTRGL